jgi:hypothetical protein
MTRLMSLLSRQRTQVEKRPLPVANGHSPELAERIERETAVREQRSPQPAPRTRPDDVPFCFD